jgi:hypothetical protein
MLTYLRLDERAESQKTEKEEKEGKEPDAFYKL